MAGDVVMAAGPGGVSGARGPRSKRLEEADPFRFLLERTSDVVVVLDPATARVRYASPSTERVLDRPSVSLLARNVFELIHPEDASRAAAALLDAADADRLELRLLHRDGSWRTVEGAVAAAVDARGGRTLVLTCRDITELRAAEQRCQLLEERSVVDVMQRRQLEERLRHAEKMEAIGRLAGGIAHDFNNTLTAILGYGGQLLTRVDAESPIRADVEEIQRAAERAASLTRQLLAFSRKQILVPRIVDVNAVLGELERMLRRLLPSGVELVTAFAPAALLARIDPSGLEHSILNLAINARDAMPSGGRLAITTEAIEALEGLKPCDFPPGSYVRIAVTDTGTGMDAETMAHVFEPFFTTKEIGRGTGLGLASIHGTITQSGGCVTVRSEVGSGTTFELYLPRVR